MRPNYSKLEDVANVIDSLHKTPRYSKTGYSMVRCTDVKYGRLSLKDTFKVDEDVFKEFSRRYKPQQSDIVITRVGSYGNTAFVEDTNFCLGQNTAAIVPKINPRFLYLALNSAHIKSQIEFAVVGSTQKTLSLKAINNLEIPRFEPFIEDRISEIVGSIDDKIDLNRRINQTLEAMAQAIFKSWFVDFDPVKAKIAAKQESRDPLRAAMSAISGKPDAELDALPREQYDQLAATAALFPDDMEESKLGEIPKGWEVSTLGAEATYLNRGISPKYIDEGGLLVLNQKCIRDFTIDPAKGRRHDPDQRSVSGRLLQAGDVLVNSTGVGTLGRVAQVLWLAEPAIVDSHVTVVRAGVRLNSTFLGQWFCLRQPDIEAMGEGSTGQTELSRGKLVDMSILVPGSLVLHAFAAFVVPLKTLISTRDRESLMLQQARDALLPRLLSGELIPRAVSEDAKE